VHIRETLQARSQKGDEKLTVCANVVGQLLDAAQKAKQGRVEFALGKEGK
jgi:hypothetical protein